MDDHRNLTLVELHAGLDHIRQSPSEAGAVAMIVRRPAAEAREVLAAAALDVIEGLVGDSWRRRRSARTPDGSAHLDMQITLMNVRVAALVARHRTRWALAGDQLFVDLDLSAANLPPGTRLSAGSAELEITAEPHTGCRKFAARFGNDALKFVSTPTGRALNLRGIYAKVVRPGIVRVGDMMRKE